MTQLLVKAKVMLTAFVNLFLCDFVGDLGVRGSCGSGEAVNCCHLSVRGDQDAGAGLYIGDKCVLHLWTLRDVSSCTATVKHKAQPSTFERLISALLG